MRGKGLRTSKILAALWGLTLHCGNHAWAYTLRELPLSYSNAAGDHTLTLVFSEELAPHATLLSELSRQALAQAERALGTPIRDDFWVYFDAEPESHNGLTTVIPNNRVYVYTEAPEAESSIGFSRDYVLETLTHEFAHMIPLQQRGGLFTPFAWVFGNASRPVGMWPRWIHEGLAVWTEGHAAGAAHGLEGRPGSGYLDFDLRRYADYVARTGKSLRDMDFDGNQEIPQLHSERVRPGHVSYHFGYLLLRSWHEERKAKDWGDVLQESGRNLGLSFRAVFRRFGKSLEHSFAREKERWAATPRPANALQNKDALASAESVAGPFAASGTLSWIEQQTRSFTEGSEDVWLRAWDGKGLNVSVPWPLRHAQALQLFATEKKDWVVLLRSLPDQHRASSYDPRAPWERSALRLDFEGNIKCWVSFPTPDARLREITYVGGELGWIRADKAGLMYAERATLADDCSLGSVNELARSRQIFERIEDLVLLPAGGYALARAEGRDSFAQFVEIAERSGQALSVRRVRSSVAALRAPQPAGAACNGCWWALEHGREHWGPVLLRPDASGWRAQRLSMATGALHVAALGDKLWVKEALWERDQLKGAEAKDFAVAVTVLKTEKLSVADPSPPTAKAAAEMEGYDVWPSIVPHFWFPTVGVTNEGYLISAQTFFDDLGRRWSGSALVGYNSYVRLPTAYAGVTRGRLGWGPFSAISVTAAYDPVYNPAAAASQGRWYAGLGVDVFHMLSDNWSARITPGFSYLQAQTVGSTEGYKLLLPQLVFNIASSRGHGEDAISHRLARTTLGFTLSNRLSYLRGPELTQHFNLHAPIGPTGLQFTLEQGWTDARNYPSYSYFTWGGVPLFTTSVTGFLARGFPELILAGPHIVRGAMQIGWSWGTLDFAAGWNRGRMSYLDTRVLAESISTYQVGKRFFTTVGAEVDFFGSIIHYVEYRLTAGFYHGFGQFGQNRVALTLRSFLEL